MFGHSLGYFEKALFLIKTAQVTFMGDLENLGNFLF